MTDSFTGNPALIHIDVEPKIDADELERLRLEAE